MHFRYYILNKPYGYLSQFTPEGRWKGLGELYKFPSDVYAVGRLDADSEGLLILTNDKALNHRLIDPKFQHVRTYLAQVDGDITEEAILKLQGELKITVRGSAHRTRGAEAMKMLLPENLWERTPTVRFRANIPTSWVQLQVTEGKNRQVRKMTAAVGFPTLRLIRTHIEQLEVWNLKSGEVREITQEELYPLLQI
jgi:23S rRNA pseudouridine2457 synthase